MLKIERMLNKMERRKERLASIVEGKSEGRGLTKKKGWRTTRSVGANFHFFHLFAPLSWWFLKSAMAVPTRNWSIFVQSPRSLGLPSHRILYLILSLISLCLAPFFQPLFHTSLSNLCSRFYSFVEDPLSFSQFIPSKTDDLPL